MMSQKGVLMAHIFTYGSLMFEPVWNRLVKGTYTSAPALLEGYARRCVKGEEYPVVFEANESVHGMVYYDVEPYDVALLDTFEGDYYERKTILLHNCIDADVYVLKKEYFDIIDDKPWSVEAFEKEGIKRFCESYKGFMTSS
jgi:gamma-glutamylcyclotransferase (GGCT)/AIG2-like uncharacterized protein YtfP